MYFQEKILFGNAGRAHFRIPSAITTKKGTVVLFCNNRLDTSADNAPEKDLVMCRKEVNGEWGDVVTLVTHVGFSCDIGSAVYDAETDKIMCFVGKSIGTDEGRAAAERGEVIPGTYIIESTDDGLTWNERKVDVLPNKFGKVGGTHGSSAGITLKHGPHAGRLLLPARYSYASGEAIPCLQESHHNCAIYSDDHGLTWQTGGEVQVGTGEGTLAELDDGTIYYNSRAYFFDGWRRIAYSHDSGESFEDFQNDPILTEAVFGVNASLLHVNEDGKTMLLFANPDAFEPMENPDDAPWKYMAKQRSNMTVRLSWDEGKTWPVSKVVFPGMAAYSSLTYCPDTKRFFLLYENGVEKHCYERLTIAEFDLEWLLSE